VSTPTITVQPTVYTVTLFPDDPMWSSVYELTVAHRDRGRWAVCRMGQCLSIDGQWHVEPSPSNRDDDWLASHRFDLDTALSMAREAAPNIRVNGRTARDVARAREGGQTPTA
jgi:hypothetical protein